MSCLTSDAVGGRTREERENGIYSPKIFIARGTLLSAAPGSQSSHGIQLLSSPVLSLLLRLRSLEQSISLLCHFAGVAGRGILAGFKTGRRWNRKKEQGESGHRSPTALFPLLLMARAVVLCIAKVHCPEYLWLRVEHKTVRGRRLYKHYSSTDA